MASKKPYGDWNKAGCFVAWSCCVIYFLRGSTSIHRGHWWVFWISKHYVNTRNKHNWRDSTGPVAARKHHETKTWDETRWNETSRCVCIYVYINRCCFFVSLRALKRVPWSRCFGRRWICNPSWRRTMIWWFQRHLKSWFFASNVSFRRGERGLRFDELLLDE